MYETDEDMFTTEIAYGIQKEVYWTVNRPPSLFLSLSPVNLNRQNLMFYL